MPTVDPWIGPRGSNADRLLRILRAHGPMTRPQAARLTGMSMSGVRPLAQTLLDAGHLVEVAHRGQGPGRPGTVLAPVPPDGVVLGLDFGHAHVHVALAGLDGHVVFDERVDVDVDHQAAVALQHAADLARRVLRQSRYRHADVRRVVAGLPGPVGNDGQLSPGTIVASWSGLDVAAEVASRLRLRLDTSCIDVENDAHLGALGEQRAGAANGRSDVVYVKASHGLGAGLILGGELHRGARGMSGELGHTVVDPAGELCRCGGRGCLETLVSVQHVRDQVRFVAGHDELADVEANPAAQRIVIDAGRTLGRALADVCTLLDVDCIVLGGELAVAGAALTEGVAESLRRYARPPHGEVDVVLAALGERAQVVGATSLAAARACELAWNDPIPIGPRGPDQ